MRLLAALAVVALSSAGAHALDLCVDSGGGSFVLKRFKIPSRNKCAPALGVVTNVPDIAVSGMGCTGANGSDVILHYTSHDWRSNTGYFETGTCRFFAPLRPDGTNGSCAGTYLTSPGGSPVHFYQLAHFQYCNVDLQL